MVWLITGHKGYVGKNLTARLDEAGKKWKGFDLKDGLDIREKNLLRTCAEGCDVIVNLAAISGIPACQKNQHEAWSTNVAGAFNVLNVAEEISALPVLVSSQAALNPTSVYGQTKLMVEGFDKRAVIVRPSNIYGGFGFDQKKNAFNYFRKANPIKLFALGAKERRDFVHVEKVINTIINLVQTNMNFGVYDVCSGEVTSIRTLAQIIAITRGVKILEIAGSVQQSDID